MALRFANQVLIETATASNLGITVAELRRRQEKTDTYRELNKIRENRKRLEDAEKVSMKTLPSLFIHPLLVMGLIVVMLVKIASFLL